VAQAHSCTWGMGAFGKRHQSPSFPSADSWADKYPGSGSLSRRLPRTTQLNISTGVPSNSKDSKNHALISLATPGTKGKPKADCFFLPVCPHHKG